MIDECKWIYLRQIEELEVNSLLLVIEEAKADGLPKDIELATGYVIRGLKTIESDASCRTFEVVWTSYVAYSVRNESFCILDEEEVWEGRLFCLYSKSHFLDYVARSTFANIDYPGPLQHWGINCEDHVLDVVSTVEPQVREIKHTLPRMD